MTISPQIRRAPAGNVYQIGVWGTIGSGKTTYLAMLYEMLANDKNVTVIASQEARKFAQDHRWNIISRGEFPGATYPGQANYDIFEYRLFLESQGATAPASEILLKFVDAPGEYYEDLAGTQKIKDGLTILSYLTSCDGIIFLLDPMRKQSDEAQPYRLLIDNLLQELQRYAYTNGMGTKIVQQIALCVSKVDQENLWEYKSEPGELIRNIIGENIFQQLENQYCKKGFFDFFAISAIGRTQDPQNPNREIINVIPKKEATPAADMHQDQPARTSTGTTQRPQRPGAQPPPAAAAPAGPSLSSRLAQQAAPLPPEVQREYDQRIRYFGDNIHPYNLTGPLQWLIRKIPSTHGANTHPASSATG
jgi:GTPase SAR1 family protein